MNLMKLVRIMLNRNYLLLYHFSNLVLKKMQAINAYLLRKLLKQIFFCLLLQERLHHFISDFLMMSLSIKALDMSISRKWVIVQ